LLGPGAEPDHISAALAQLERHRGLASSTFHVWWPIAPAGYVALGCVVTAARAAAVASAVPISPIEAGASLAVTAGLEDNAAASEAVSAATGAPSGVDIPAPLHHMRAAVEFETHAVPPAADAVLCVHWSLVRPAELAIAYPLPSVSMKAPRQESADAASSASTPSDFALPSTATTSSDDDAWFEYETDVSKSAAAISPPPIVMASASLTVADARLVQSPLAASIAFESGSSGAAAASLLADSSFPRGGAKLAAHRALHSRGVALYSVRSRAATFVAPVPVSVQRTSSSASGGYSGGPEGSGDSAEKSGPGAPQPFLGSTPVPPAPEFCDATLHKAHAFASAVAFDLGAELSATIGPSVRFSDQHWGCDAVATAAHPISATLRYTPYGSAICAGPSSGAWDFDSVHSLTGPRDGGAVHLGSEYAFSALADVEVALRPPVVCVRVRSSAAAAQLLANLALPASPHVQQAHQLLAAVPTNTVLAVSANGVCDRFSVFSRPQLPRDESQ
jgi:hypothetical protein